jgi:insecticidal toxin complex protein TccC
VLRWESETPKDAANDQYRYHLNDHLGSCTLELDGDGEVISQERYHPFGTTAWFAGRGEVEASYRTVRYSGKERDATGLYYYGFRYYVAEWQRWLNTDPLGPIDGLNVYGMTLNNPIRFIDRAGTISEVPRQINWIWLGGPLPVEAAININEVVEEVPDYSATLWVDSKAWSSGHGLALENLRRRVRVANVSEVFQGLDPKVYAAFEREHSGPLKNYPAASDIARMAVLSKAGVYLDVDVQLAKSFPRLLNAPNGLLAYKRTNTTINNSALAAGEGSPVVSKALSSIANEYSSSTSSTWVKKRAYPRPAEVAAALEKRSDYLRGLEDEIAAMDLAILTNPSGVPHSLMFAISSKQNELQAAQELELEDFLPSARVTETMRITGPGLIRSALGRPDGLTSFEVGQFKPIDASGEAIFRKPSVLRRASIS